MVKMDTSHETVKILTEVGHDGFSDHDTNWTTFLYHLELQQQGRTNSWFMELEKLGECDSSDEKAPRKWLMNNWALVWAIYKEQPFDDINKGICEDYKDTILCRRCDVEGCRYGRLGQTCTFARITHLFDNGAAVFLDFMSLWVRVIIHACSCIVFF
ncbi:anoctamin-2-like isoform X5 [Tachypleus tridentatus]|uniref:anoctamin-2-like isoform X5 n=1 Tax=Tachypleus tridentatus TaxID=6853 RepID=UPI003FD38BE6